MHGEDGESNHSPNEPQEETIVELEARGSSQLELLSLLHFTHESLDFIVKGSDPQESVSHFLSRFFQFPVEFVNEIHDCEYGDTLIGII